MDEIAKALRGRWLRPPAEPTAPGLTTDSRTARPGELFVALRGERFDGHDFLAAAQKTGCAAAVARRDAPQIQDLPGGEMGLLLVPDTTRALGQLALHYRGTVAADVVAVTGSNGKTTVVRMIHHILSRRLAGSCSPNSYNNAVGVPLTLLAVEPAHDYVVCEIGTNAPGEVEALGRIARPDVGVITSIGPTHLAGLGSVERVAVEKASLLPCVAADGLAVVWADSDVLAKAVATVQRRRVRFGASPDADLRLTAYEPRGRGQRFQLNGRLWVELPVSGRHNALNALAAIAVARRFGIDESDAAAALADFPGAEMRLEWIEAGGVTLISDVYNANPASVAAAADVLAEAEGGRRVMIVADMLELGGRARELHVETGEALASRRIDLLIGVGRLGRYIARGASGLPATETFASVAKASRAVGDLLRTGDVVLVKGSRAMKMERVVEAVRAAFDPAAPPRRARATKGRRR